jgi:hypothetical protein
LSSGTLLAGIKRLPRPKAAIPTVALQLLAEQYPRLPKRDFARLLRQMAKKHNIEWSDIHAALTAKARAGDMDVIKLYREAQSTAGSGESGGDHC